MNECATCGHPAAEPFTDDEIRRLRKLLNAKPSRAWTYAYPPCGPLPSDEAAADARMARRKQNPNDDLSRGITL